jgi:hypothetical protein
MADRPIPDPARSYERAKPEAESGMGRLDNNKSTPTDDPDRMKQSVKNAQPPRQLNADETVDQNRSNQPGPGIADSKQPKQPDHSMHEEEPTDPDLAPADIHDKRNKRHPRTEGKGGTP